MAVLVEAISVIVRRDAIDNVYTSGWTDFLDDVPNATLCTDGELARVGFMAPDDVERFIDLLCRRGLAFLANGKCQDIAIVDQQRGPTMPCDWLEFTHFPYGDHNGRVSACWLYEDQRIAHGVHFKGTGIELVTPPGWDFESSLSAKFNFVPNEDADE